VRFCDDYDWYDEYDPADDAQKGYCAECHEWVTGVTIDEGIGHYEYWGCQGIHHDYRTVSPCCEADLLDKLPEEKDNE
jgi:hypothetical protein